MKQEKELISIELDKMHYLWELGLKSADLLKNYTINELKKKLDKVPEFAKAPVKRQIKEIKTYSPKEFLNSTYGRSLKHALVKEGMSKMILEYYKNEIIEDRKKKMKRRQSKIYFYKTK